MPEALKKGKPIEVVFRTEKKATDLKERMRQTNGARYVFKDIICESPKSIQGIEDARKLAKLDIPVLIIARSYRYLIPQILCLL
nr:hypothetical protein [uncultured Aminipila sp.]